MTNEEMTELYKSDNEFKKFVEAEADRRVNQARESWEKKLPALAEEQVQAILKDKEKSENIKKEIKGFFTESKIPYELGFSLLGDYQGASPGELETKLTEVKEQAIGIIDTSLKASFKSTTPVMGDGPKQFKPLSEASSSEILNNLDYYNRKE